MNFNKHDENGFWGLFRWRKVEFFTQKLDIW